MEFSELLEWSADNTGVAAVIVAFLSLLVSAISAWSSHTNAKRAHKSEQAFRDSQEEREKRAHESEKEFRASQAERELQFQKEQREKAAAMEAEQKRRTAFAIVADANRVIHSCGDYESKVTDKFRIHLNSKQPNPMFRKQAHDISGECREIYQTINAHEEAGTLGDLDPVKLRHEVNEFRSQVDKILERDFPPLGQT